MWSAPNTCLGAALKGRPLTSGPSLVARAAGTLFGPRRRPALRRSPVEFMHIVEIQQIEIEHVPREGGRARTQESTNRGPLASAGAGDPRVETGGSEASSGQAARRRPYPRRFPRGDEEAAEGERSGEEGDSGGAAESSARRRPRPRSTRQGGLWNGIREHQVSRLIRSALRREDMDAVGAMLHAIESGSVASDVDLDAFLQALLVQAARASMPALRSAFAIIDSKDRAVDAPGYRAAAAARLSQGDWEGYHEVLASMREKGYSPDGALYASWARALILSGEIEQVPKILDEMRAVDRQRPPAYVYSTVIDAIHTVYGHKMASDAVELAFSRNDFEGPATPIYNSAIRICLRDGRFKRAEEYWTRMRTRDVPVDGYTVSMVMNLYAKQGRYQELAELFTSLRNRDDFELTFVHLASYIEGMLKSRRYSPAWTLLKEMEKDGSDYPPSSHTYGLFVRSLCEWDDDAPIPVDQEDPLHSAGVLRPRWGPEARSGGSSEADQEARRHVRLSQALAVVRRADARGIDVPPSILRTLCFALQRMGREQDLAVASAKLQARARPTARGPAAPHACWARRPLPNILAPLPQKSKEALALRQRGPPGGRGRSRSEARPAPPDNAAGASEAAGGSE
eukprot:tig00021435_g21435.t1